MSDKADHTDDITELFMREAMSNRNKARRTLVPTGFCFYCTETVNSGELFCNKFCRDDYQDEQRRLEIQGKV